MTSRSTLARMCLEGDRASCCALASALDRSQLVTLAVKLLDTCCVVTPVVPGAVRDVVRVGAHEPGRGHALFDAVRGLTLAAERHGASPADPGCVLLFVAENAARVIYNSSQPADPFDDDAVAWLLIVTSQMVGCLHGASQDRLKAMLLPLLAGGGCSSS